MLALTLINLCSREYQDVGFERIGRDATSFTTSNGQNWLDLLNDAQRAVVLARPDANAVTESVLLIAGTRQTLPSGSYRLLDVTRNMGVAGTTAGDTIRMADRDMQDMVNRSWHAATAAAVTTVVRDVFYNDKKDPLTFWVKPKIPTTPAVYIEITTSKVPTDVSIANVTSGSIQISEAYASAMQEWMLFRAYMMATQALNQFQRAQFHLSTFFNLLGIKMKNDMFESPNAPDTFPAFASDGR